MGLITCPDCGSTASDRASACPRCGRPLRRLERAAWGYGGGAYVFGALMLFLMFAASLRGIDRRPRAASPDVTAPRTNPAILTPADFGGSWPLAADSLVLACRPATRLLAEERRHVLAVVDGRIYAVHGLTREDRIMHDWADFSDLLRRPGDPPDGLSPAAEAFRADLARRGLAMPPARAD